jgi:hypothetical protein
MRSTFSCLLAALVAIACTTVSRAGEAPEAAAGEKGFAIQRGHAAGDAAPAGTVNGRVLETLDAGAYTYLHLSTASGETWAAVPRAAVPVGAQVVIAGAMPMDGFESKTLNRKFERIVFGTLAGPPGRPPLRAGGALPAGHPAVPAGPVADVKVAKAEAADGRTVAEVWAQKAALKDKPVTIHGTVVKFTAGVLGKNWLHLRDGSGSREKADDDVTVTTGDAAAVGDVVTVAGTVRLDRDFGSGYSYAVIIEEAKVTK